MPSLTVRIDEDTHRTLRRLAVEVGEPMTTVLARAVDEYERRVFLDGLSGDFAKLRADREVWQEELSERAMWDPTLLDGLHDD